MLITNQNKDDTISGKLNDASLLEVPTLTTMCTVRSGTLRHRLLEGHKGFY